MKNIFNRIKIYLTLKMRKDLSVDLKSKISKKTLKKIQGLTQYKIIIRNSILNDVTASYGCQILDSTLIGEVKLGRFVVLTGPGIRLNAKLNKIFIGSFTSVAPNVIFQEYNHITNRISTFYFNKLIFKRGYKDDVTSKGNIIVEEDVWIGSNSIILSGVKVGRGSIVAAGSVVTKDIPKYSISAGNPARVIKKRFTDDQIRKLEDSKWWEKDISELLRLQLSFNTSLDSDSDINEILKVEK